MKLYPVQGASETPIPRQRGYDPQRLAQTGGIGQSPLLETLLPGFVNNWTAAILGGLEGQLTLPPSLVQ
jgi:hypothetical protein